MGGESAGGGGAGDDFGGSRNARAFAGNPNNPFGGAVGAGGSGEAAANLASAARMSGSTNTQALSGVAEGVGAVGAGNGRIATGDPTDLTSPLNDTRRASLGGTASKSLLGVDEIDTVDAPTTKLGAAPQIADGLPTRLDPAPANDGRSSLRAADRAVTAPPSDIGNDPKNVTGIRTPATTRDPNGTNSPLPFTDSPQAVLAGDKQTKTAAVTNTHKFSNRLMSEAPASARADRAKTDSTLSQREAKEIFGITLSASEIANQQDFQSGINRASAKVGDTGKGNLSTPSESLIGRTSSGIGAKEGKPGVSTQRQTGNFEIAGTAANFLGVIGGGVAGKGLDRATNFAAGEVRTQSFEATDKPETSFDFSKAFGDDGDASRRTGPRGKAKAKTAASATKAKATPLTQKQRLARQRGRSASTSTGVTGRGTIASKILLGA